MTSPILRRVAAASALVLAAGLAACGDDEPSSVAQSSATPMPPATSTPAASATGPTAVPTPSAAPGPTASTAPSTSAEPDGSGSDQNGDFEGQLILEYPGTPLRRTASTTPNDDVQALQIRLSEVGYRVDTDGRFDADTEKVVIAFQRDNGLTPDGIVGQATWAALFTFEG